MASIVENSQDIYQAIGTHTDLWCWLVDHGVSRSKSGGTNMSCEALEIDLTGTAREERKGRPRDTHEGWDRMVSMLIAYGGEQEAGTAPPGRNRLSRGQSSGWEQPRGRKLQWMFSTHTTNICTPTRGRPHLREAVTLSWG